MPDRPATELWDALVAGHCSEHGGSCSFTEGVAFDGYRDVLAALEGLLKYAERTGDGALLAMVSQALARQRERLQEALDG